MNRILAIILFGLTYLTYGQKRDTTEVTEMFGSPEKPAMPMVGLINYYQWINENNQLKYATDTLSSLDKVFLEIRIAKTGEISEVKIAKGIGEPYDREAIRLIKENPSTWMPAENRNKKCESTLILPIYFVDKIPQQETKTKNKKKGKR